MKLKIFILFGLLYFSTLLNAQTDFRPGYIINLNGDTIYGKINYQGNLLMGTLCKFRDKENIELKYLPNEITAFRFIDSKYYVSRVINETPVFLEYLIKGKVNIYYMRDNNGDHYYLDKEGFQLAEITYKEGFKTINDNTILYRSKEHIELLNTYMQDAPEFQSRIQSIKKPEHKSLIKLAADYHTAVCDGEKCIIYEKKQPFIKVNLEGVMGVVNFENLEPIYDKYYLQSGIIAHIWIPSSNEKIFLKTGILYSLYEQYGGKEDQIFVPIHLGYMAPSTFRIRPSFSVGLLSPSYSAGVVTHINKKINLGIQSWLNFDQTKYFFLFPDRLNNFSILGNLYIEL